MQRRFAAYRYASVFVEACVACRACVAFGDFESVYSRVLRSFDHDRLRKKPPHLTAEIILDIIIK